MLKKIINIILITFLITSCGAMGEVKRGLTGSKKQSTDEFFIQKKDPLILPPNYKDLPTPDEKKAAKDEISEFEKSLGASIEETSSNSNSNTEESILKRIKNK